MQTSTFFIIFGAICLLGYLLYIQPPLNKPPTPEQLAAQAVATNVVVQPAAPAAAQSIPQNTSTSGSPDALTPAPSDSKHHSMDELSNPK